MSLLVVVLLRLCVKPLCRAQRWGVDNAGFHRPPEEPHAATSPRNVSRATSPRLEDHPLCGGWILPVRGVDDPLRALGVVLLGAGKPVVLCAVDWTGIRNEAFRTWRAALAEAAHTTPEHVSLHTVHPHNTPFADIEAEKLIAAAGAAKSLDLKYFDECVKKSADALKASLMKAVPFTHIGTGSAEVKDVASNRRVLGDDGKVKFTRTSATKSKEARDAPQGLIDPRLPHAFLLGWREATRCPALLRLPPDELLRRRPRERRLQWSRTAEVSG